MGRGNIMINTFQYHDTARAEFLIKNGLDGSQYIFNDMRILALYYRDVLGYKPQKRKEELLIFLKNNIADFNEVLYLRNINRALNIAKNKKKKLIDIDYINVYKSEIDYINSLDVNENTKKILFTMLVKIKISKEINKILNDKDYEGYFLGKKIRIKDIIKLSNLSNNKKTTSIFHNLYKLDYIKPYSTGSIKVNIFYDMPVDETEVALQVKDYNNIGYYYDYYIGKNIKFCEICGMPFRPKAKNGKYCKEHQGYQAMETKVITCIDCGKEIEINSNNKRQNRCDECYKIYRKVKVKEAKDRWKINQNKE